MASDRLYENHPPGLAATYADVENHAESQGEALVGTAGSIALRRNATGSEFYVRQYYDHDKVKRVQYLVSKEAPGADATVADWTKRINDTRDLIETVRLLSREGYSLLTPKHFAAIAPLANHGVFQAGAMLIGTHAFEVIVNRLGVRCSPYATEDVDVARPGKLALPSIPKGGLLEMLRESGIDFVAVPPLDPRQPSTKFKEKGRSRFTFDLLVPSSSDDYEVLEVPELQVHATALPYLRYLLGESQPGAALSSHGVAAVRVPVPERFALHKMVVAQLRRSGNKKVEKDQRQAAVLVAATGEIFPGALESAYKKTPLSVRRHIRKSFEAIQPLLEAHPQSLEEIRTLIDADSK